MNTSDERREGGSENQEKCSSEMNVKGTKGEKINQQENNGSENINKWENKKAYRGSEK